MKDLSKRLITWAVVVAVLLSAPFFLMQFQIPVWDPGSGMEQVGWTLSDFIFAGALLYGAGLVYILATMNVQSKLHRFLIGLALFLVLAFVWGVAATG